MIEYANWLRNKRLETNLQQETLASQAGVTAATISRIENNGNDVTFITAYKICQALSVSLSSLISEMNVSYDIKLSDDNFSIYGNTNNASELTSTHELRSNSIRYDDLGKFQNVFLNNAKPIFEFICIWLNRISYLISYQYKNENEDVFKFTPELTSQLFNKNSLVMLKINYPQKIQVELLPMTNKSNGVLTQIDVGEYINLKRKITQQSLRLFSNGDESISKSSLSRIESGIVERIRLIDIFELDNRFNENGKLIDMFWNVARFTTQCELKQSLLTKNDNSYDLKKYSILFIIIGRWMQVLSNNNSTWINELRKDLELLN